MSEMQKQDREWRLFITHMIESGEAVMSFTEGLDINDFQRDQRTYKATLWDIRIIGEAATRIPDEIREANPHILDTQFRMLRIHRNMSVRSCDQKSVNPLSCASLKCRNL